MVVVIPPGGGDPDPARNPLLNLKYEAAQLALLVGTALQSDGGKQAAVDAGGTGEFTVESTFGASSNEQLTPQLNISADASNPESARRSVHALVEYAAGILDKVQLDAGVPVENDARLVWAIEPQAGKNVSEGRTRRAGAYAAVTLLAGAVLIMLLDGLLERRRGRKARGQTRPDDDDGPPSTPADVGGAAAENPLKAQTMVPRGSRRSRHRYRPEPESEFDVATNTNPLSISSPPTPSRPDPP
jgi:hypothetical protein